MKQWKYYGVFASVVAGILFLWMTLQSMFYPVAQYPEIHYSYFLFCILCFELAVFLLLDYRKVEVC